MRCTGPLAMSTVVWPARLTIFGSAPFEIRYSNHLVVAARRRVVNRGVAFVLARVDVDVELFDEILDRGEHAARRELVVVGGEAFAVALTGGRQQRRDARTADRDRRRAWRCPARLTFADVAGARPAGALRVVGMF